MNVTHYARNTTPVVGDLPHKDPAARLQALSKQVICLLERLWLREREKINTEGL